ncbi:MAG: DUF4350 domain-containing protein, partial [Nitrososphaerota archaeon]
MSPPRRLLWRSRSDMWKLDPKPVLFGLASAMLVLSLASVLMPTSEDFQQSNTYWNGLSTFFGALKATPLDVALYKVVPENSALFLIGPSSNITEPRLKALKSYVSEGGTLILMDETGAINSLLSSFELGIAVDGHFMFDPVFYYGSWKLPKILNIGGGALTSGVESIALNLPSILKLNSSSSNLRVLARSSSFSFLDLDGDCEPSLEEPAGPFVVAVEVPYGKGRVIVFSDSSLFLNGVIGLGDNLRILENIARGKAVFVDVGVWQPSPQLAYRSAVLNAYNIISAPELKYTLAFIAVAVICILTFREDRTLKPDEV